MRPTEQDGRNDLPLCQTSIVDRAERGGGWGEPMGALRDHLAALGRGLSFTRASLPRRPLPHATDLVQWADGPLWAHPDVCPRRRVVVIVAAAALVVTKRRHEALVVRLDVPQQRGHPRLPEQEVVSRHVVVVGSIAAAIELKLAEELREGYPDREAVAVADVVGVARPPHLDTDRVAAVPEGGGTGKLLDSCRLLVGLPATLPGPCCPMGRYSYLRRSVLRLHVLFRSAGHCLAGRSVRMTGIPRK